MLIGTPTEESFGIVEPIGIPGLLCPDGDTARFHIVYPKDAIGGLPMPAAVHAVAAELPLQPGSYALCWQVLDGAIPVRPAGGADLEYGLFLDHTEDPTDGFVAAAPFVFDPRSGASRWLSLRHASGDRWRAVAHQVGADGVAHEVPSAARVIVTDRVVLWLVPVAELPRSTALFARHGTFWHLGDFGQLGGEWAADCTPDLDGPAYGIPLGAYPAAAALRVSPR